MATRTITTGTTISNQDLGGTTFVIPDGSSDITITQTNLDSIQCSGSVSDLTITKNNFVTPDEFDAITIPGVGSNIIITDNDIDLTASSHEGIHAINGTGASCQFSYNHIHGASRHGIEAQWHGSENQFNYNLIDQWRKNPGDNNQEPPTDSHIALSIAMGNDGPTPASNNQVVGNAVDFSSGDITVPIPAALEYLTCGIEYMGNTGLVKDNWIKNNGILLYSNDNEFTSQNNAIIGGKSWQAEGGVDPANPPTVIGDKSYAWGDPAAPPMPTDVGPRFATGYQGDTPVPPIPPVQTLALIDNKDGTVSITAPSPISTLTISPLKPNPAYPPAVLPFPVASATAKVGNIPLNWEIVATSGALTGQIQSTGGQPAGTTWAPTLLSPVAPPVGPTLVLTVTVTSVTKFMSDHTSSTVSTTVATKP